MADRDQLVIVQPMGAIEQHGPHLPLAVDSAICTTVLGKALAQLDPSVPVYSLPPLYYGKSNEHWHFPGTITLSVGNAAAGDSRYRRKPLPVWVSQAGAAQRPRGQPQVLEIAARDLHQAHDDLMVFPLFVWAVPNCAGELLTAKEMELGIHAGDAETSLMLTILPDQVRMDQAKAEFPHNLPTDSWLTMEGRCPLPGVTRDLSASGVFGRPHVWPRWKRAIGCLSLWRRAG
jgi:creatinine amidohydrolase